MKINPLFDRVIIKTVDPESRTKSGIVLPQTAKERPLVAKVLAVGPGENYDGKDVKMFVKKGDKVLYSKYAGSEFKIDGEEVVIIRQSDILAILEEE